MKAAAEGQVGNGLRQRVGVCGEDAGAVAEGAAVCENGESEFVGAESWDAVVVAVAAGGAVKDGACERELISQCQAQKGRSEVQRQSAAVSDGSAAADGGMGVVSAAAPVVCGARCYLHSFRHCLLHVCPLRQPHQC